MKRLAFFTLGSFAIFTKSEEVYTSQRVTTYRCRCLYKGTFTRYDLSATIRTLAYAIE